MSRMRPIRFEIHEHNGRHYIDDDDFGFDALIDVNGDFVDDEKKRFLEAVCAVLNENEARIPTAHQMRSSTQETSSARRKRNDDAAFALGVLRTEQPEETPAVDSRRSCDGCGLPATDACPYCQTTSCDGCSNCEHRSAKSHR